MNLDIFYFLSPPQNEGGDPRIDFMPHNLENTSPLDYKNKTEQNKKIIMQKGIDVLNTII